MMGYILPTFLKRYPRIRLAIVMTNRPVDLIEERIDVALRVRESYSGDQTVVVRKFASTREFLAASPSFVAAHAPITLDNLSTLPTLAIQEHTGRAPWTLVNTAGEVRDIAHNPVFSSVEFGMLERAAIEGVGIGYAPPLWDPALAKEIIGVSTNDAKEMTRRLAREESLFAGTSSGANVTAAIRVGRRLGPRARVVTLLVDSGLKYLSTDVYRSG